MSTDHMFSSALPTSLDGSKNYVLLAVDESKYSEDAISYTIENVLRPDETLMLLHVYDVPLTGAPDLGFASTDTWQQLVNKASTHARAVAGRYAAICKAKKVPFETFVVEGDAREIICKASDDLSPRLLVVASRGKGAVKRMLLGSVSDYCVHHAKCSVLVIKN